MHARRPGRPGRLSASGYATSERSQSTISAQKATHTHTGNERIVASHTPPPQTTVSQETAVGEAGGDLTHALSSRNYPLEIELPRVTRII